MKDQILNKNIKRIALKSSQTKFIIMIFIRTFNLKQDLKIVINSQLYKIKKKKCNIMKYYSILYFVKIFKYNNLMKTFVIFMQQCC